MKNLLYIFVCSIFIATVFTACGDNQSSTESTNTTTEETKPEVKEKKYVLTAFDPSPTYENAVIEEMTYNDGKFGFTIPEGEYALGAQTPDADSKMCANSAKGQHIHLIVDNEPYAAKYEASFDYEIADGEHYILSFLSRSYHESIKDQLAAKAVKVNIENNTITEESSIVEPMLFYSRPKGTYVGKDTEKVMLDFYLVNATMDDYSVNTLINGEEHIIDEWKPFYIENLPYGENEITLTLIDKDGNKVDTPLNPVTRNFTLEQDKLQKK